MTTPSSQLVPLQILNKLCCSNCKKPLSIFPVYLLIEKQQVVCGRCKIPKEESVMRNEAYENLAKSLKFPCCNNDNGCLEYFLPEKMPLHEKFCFHKVEECPKKIYNDCAWKGKASSLLEHFEEKHLVFLLKELRFEVNFLNSYKENYLIPHIEELYVLNIENNSKSSVFSCSLYYVGSNSFVQNYTYNIVLESGNKSYPVTIPKLDSAVDIKVDDVRKALRDPVTIVASINITYDRELGQKDVQDESQEGDDINYDMLSEIECPVCFYYMTPPIFQCIIGHSICEKCKMSQTECPSCKKPFGDTQNYALEKMTGHLVYPCKHENCKFTAKAKDIRQHEKLCIFGPYDCPLKDYTDCTYSSDMTHILEHITDHHHENLLEIDTITAPFFNLDEPDRDCFILKFYYNLFKLHYKHEDGSFYWAMQLIGPPEESMKYKFEIDVLDNNGNKLRAYQKGICSPLSNPDEAFSNSRNYVVFEIYQLQALISDELTYRVRILME